MRAAVAAVVLAAALGAAWTFLAPAPQLAFTPLERPEGFRALRLSGVSRGADPLFGLDADAAPPPPADVCALLREGPAIGPDAAPVRIASFSDYRCPYCRVLSAMLADIADGGAAQVVHHEWPVFGAYSALAARAALAADRQGAYAAMHARLMRAAFAPTPAYLEAVALELGLDAARLQRDMDHPATTAALARTAALAGAFGMIGTPTLVVGATMVEGAVTRAQLDAVIAAERDRAGAGPCAAW